MTNVYFNLTQMLQGCSKRNGMTVSASSTYRSELRREPTVKANVAVGLRCRRCSDDVIWSTR